VANVSSGDVSVLLGNGDGTFQPSVNYGAHTQPVSLAVADFNGDGKPDLAAANFGSGDVSVLLGNGDGTFQLAVNFGADSFPQSVAAGDLNGDGRADLVVANQGSDDASVLLNTTSPGADLSITNSGSPNPVVSGNRLTYTVSVTNNGSQAATGVTVTDPLPASLHFNSVSSTQGSCTRSTSKSAPKDGTVTCSLGGLANGASASITIVVTTTTPGMLTNTATVGGNETDPNPLNNSASATTTVIGI
jgi:uncharacterized repeat protein (TIGR01451 family)